jgi:hypothetical protein
MTANQELERLTRISLAARRLTKAMAEFGYDKPNCWHEYADILYDLTQGTPDETDEMWTGCTFVGNPPAGYDGWNGFVNAPIKRGVTIQASVTTAANPNHLCIDANPPERAGPADSRCPVTTAHAHLRLQKRVASSMESARRITRNSVLRTGKVLNDMR